MTTNARTSIRVLNTLGPLLGLVFVFTLFAVIGPESFSSLYNLETIARQTAIVGTAALGMTLIIIAGGIIQCGAILFLRVRVRS